MDGQLRDIRSGREPYMNGPRTDFLKLIACISMLIDHIGAILEPALLPDSSVFILRAIGRLAFPVFAYHTAVGFVNTKNIGKYFLRLFIFALISQYPYTLAFGGGLNVMATLFLGLGAIWLFDRANGTGCRGPVSLGGIGFPGVALAAFVAQLTDCDYGAFGVITVFLFYYFKDRPGICAIAQLIMLTSFIFLNGSPHLRYFALTGYALIFAQTFGVRYPGIIIGKYFFYVFYPAHLLILTMLLAVTPQ